MKMIMKNEYKTIEQKLSELIGQGNDISRVAVEDEVYSDMHDDLSGYLTNLHRDYFTWWEKIRSFLKEDSGVNALSEDIFWKEDSVPKYMGSLEYAGDKNKAGKLVRNIKIEVEKKLDYLRELKIKWITKKDKPDPIDLFDRTVNPQQYQIGQNEKIINELKKINIVNEQGQKESNKSINTQTEPNTTPKVIYNNKTGVGFIGKKQFKFKNHQPEFFVFGEMYEKIENPILRKEVLQISSKSKNYKESTRHDTETYFINNLASKMRKRTGLNATQIVNNNGDLTLVGKKVPETD